MRRLSGARILHEMQMICAESDPLPIFARIGELDLWREIFPELKTRVPEGRRAARLQAVRKVISWYEYLYLEEKVSGWRVYLLAFLDGLNAGDAAYCIGRLGFDDNSARHFLAARRRGIDAAAELGRLCRRPVVANSRLCREVEGLTLEILLYIMAGHRSSAVKKFISSYITGFQFVAIETNGHDLIELGLKPGPVFKKILDKLREARLDGLVRNRKDELALVAELREKYPDA